MMLKDWLPKVGETPYEDLSGFKHFKKYPHPTRLDIDELEEENVLQATLKYLSKKPSSKIARFDFDWFLRLHKEMFGNVWDWAGALRTQNTQIGLDKLQIREALQGLSKDIPEWPTYFDDPNEIAARIHHRAVYIHPFRNGNGRWSRLLANIWLKQNDHGVTEWPVVADVSAIRHDYLNAVRAADNGDFHPLINLHREYMTT